MSNTKINLEYPYDQDWKTGYLNTNSEGRKTLTLYNSEIDRSSTQYARYLISVKEKRYLNSSEHVDHIDEDKTNDKLDNLQILSPKDNNIKTHKLPDIDLICPICGKSFSRSHTFLRGKLERAYNNDICCSKSCGGRKGSITRSS